MNFYKRHLGDLAKSCGDLSQGQMGAYDLLLDWHYGNEKAIPLAKDKQYRIGRATTKAERLNVDSVIAELFTETPTGYVHKRALEEMEKANEQADRNREVGKLGGRPKKTKVVMENNHSGFENETENNPSHKPLATSQQVTTTSSPPITSEAQATEAGRACLLMRQAGCGHTNPSNANLLAALSEGITPEKLADFARAAEGKGIKDPFAYAITAARNDRVSTGTVTPIKPKANDNFQGKSYVGTPDDQLPASLR